MEIYLTEDQVRGMFAGLLGACAVIVILLRLHIIAL